MHTLSGQTAVPSPVRKLATAWFLLALAALGLSLLTAAVLVVARTPLLALGASVYGPAYALHAVLATMTWLLGAAGAIALASSRAGLAGWGCWWLTLAGMAALLVSAWLGGGLVSDSYLPLFDTPLFLGGMGTFALAIGMVVLRGLMGMRRLLGGAPWMLAVAWVLPALGVPLALALSAVAVTETVAGVAVPLQGIGHALQFVYVLLLMAAWASLAAGLLPGIRGHRPILHGIYGLAALPVVGCIALAVAFPAGGPEYKEGLDWLLRWASWPAAVLLLALLAWRLVWQTRQGPLTAEQKWLGLSLSLYALGIIAGAAIYANPAAAQAHGNIIALIAACIPWWRRGMSEFSVGGTHRSPSPGRGRDIRPWAITITLLLVIGGGWLLQSLPRLSGAFSPREHAAAQIKADIDSRFQQGVVMLHARQYEHALTAFHRVLELAPEMPEAHVNMGFALIGLKRYKEAGDFFESATQLRPNQVNAYYGLAVAQEGTGNLRGALEAMEAYVHLAKPDDAFLPKARAAIWEWRAAVETARPRESSGGSDEGR